MGRIVARSFEETPADPIERLFVSPEILADTWTTGSGLSLFAACLQPRHMESTGQALRRSG